MKLRDHAEIERLRKLYNPIDKIGDIYAKAINRQTKKMIRIMGVAFAEKIAPIIREYQSKIKKLDIKTNADRDKEKEAEMQKILFQYSGMIEHEIAAAMFAINQLWEPQYLEEVVARFTEALSEAQRRILMTEIFEEIGKTNPVIAENIEHIDDGIGKIVEEYNENNLKFLPEIMPAEYGERVKTEIVENFKIGLGLNALSALLMEIGNIAVRRGEFVAHDQTETLYAELTATRQTDVGIGFFTWETMRDSSVRPSHALLDGNIYSWFEGAVGAGEDGADIFPGEEYGCRCIARAHAVEG